MPTPKNADYKKRQRKQASPTLFNGTAGATQSRAHPNRQYVWRNGTCWRKENYEARFGRL